MSDISNDSALLLSRKRAETELKGFNEAEVHFLRLQVNELRAEVEALRADAERYRWLRGDTASDHSKRWTQWEIRCWQAPRWTDDLRWGTLDAAVDAAMELRNE